MIGYLLFKVFCSEEHAGPKLLHPGIVQVIVGRLLIASNLMGSMYGPLPIHRKGQEPPNIWIHCRIDQIRSAASIADAGKEIANRFLQERDRRRSKPKNALLKGVIKGGRYSRI